MATTTPKIIDLLNEHSDASKVSLEFFPPRSQEGVENLCKRMDRMLITSKPLFTDITWGAGGSTADLSLQLALYAQRTGHTANLHLTCTNLGRDNDPKEYLRAQLEAAKAGAIRNIVALRGDPPEGQETWTASSQDFTCALDLVQFIRNEFGDYFGISVAGYPEGHPNAISEIHDASLLSATEQARASTFDGKTYVCKDEDYEKEMAYLKQKVDAGADFIITQMFFDVQVFLTFCQDCRKWGITCPIVPGVMCINAHAGFSKMSKFCKTRVPNELAEQMEALKDDVAGVKQFGMEFGASVCQTLLDHNVPVLHFYTLNLEKVVYGILDLLGWSKNGSSLLANANEMDASSQVAVGSAWTRVGDPVKSIYGEAIVTEIRPNGTTVVEMNKWIMAGGQKPIAYLQKDSFDKC